MIAGDVHGEDGDATAAGPRAQAAPRAQPGAPAFPIPDWDRYRCIRFLGQGGMGIVFLARDLRLQRDVAIKFVRGDDPGLARRLVAEARAQARVSHERVCAVHEVGEVSGQVYIAMQYVHGEPLGALEVGVEQTAMLVRDAALGVHEAHRVGLIHRDIKPSNILVKRADDGRLEAYVMDFGLARDWNVGSTETGTVLGTPYYMAPEQARGDVKRLDRRADVYALGATLYHVLTGVPPIPGDNGLEVLNNVAAVEPRPPRALDPDIPADLEAIVLRCLEKDRSARYDSARALSDDLDRFLRGEVVTARSAGALYRVQKALRRHRRAAALSAAAFVLIAAALGFGIKARVEASERERLARRFTEQVERIEATARYASLSPLHDVSADRLGIRAKMDGLAAEVERAGPVAAALGSYALGRGHLALGEDALAKEQLEAAWQRGLREPRVAYALALSLGHIYRDRLREVDRAEQNDAREAKRREIELHYRDPALAYLRQSAGAEVPSVAYVSALVAFYEGRLDDALHDLDSISAEVPWFYEAPELRGDVLAARAAGRRDRGDREGARADFAAGRAAYREAASVGESVASVHYAMASLESASLIMEMYGGGDVRERFEAGALAVERALRVEPEHYASLVLGAALRRRMAEHRLNRGEKVDDLLDRAIASAARAAEIAPARPEARLELGRARWQRGMDIQNQGRDPTEELRAASAIYDGIEPPYRDYEYYRQVGLIFDVWADHQAQASVDSTESRRRAIGAFLEATRVDPRLPNAWINLGTSYFMRASQPSAPDPDGDLDEAEKALRAARDRDAGNTVSHFYGAEVLAARALRKRARGADPGPDLTAALELDTKGIALDPGLPHLHNGAGLILMELARDAWDRGGDPGALLERAQKAFERAIAAAPDQGFAHNNIAEGLELRAQYESARGEDPAPAALAALAALERAIALIPENATPWVNQAVSRVIIASYELERGRDPAPSVALAKASLEQAIKRSPTEPMALRYVGEVRLIEARALARKKKARAADFEDAARSIERAVAGAPEVQEHRVALARARLAWASWQRDTGADPIPMSKLGLDAVGQVLSARPTWADALVARASLFLLQAQASAPREEARKIAAMARDDFARALSESRNLERAYRGLANAARDLASP